MREIAGGIKTLLEDYEQNVGEGHGSQWRGILFCRRLQEREHIIDEAFKLFNTKAKYNKAGGTWTFPGGETLRIQRIRGPQQSWEFHGLAFPWVGFDKARANLPVAWFNPFCMLSRSSDSQVQKLCRILTTPETEARGKSGMVVQVHGQQFECESLRIVSLHEDGTKRLVLYGIPNIEPEDRVVSDLNPGEIVTIKI